MDGRVQKRREVNLAEHPDVIGIQETKASSIDLYQISYLWGGAEVDFVQAKASGNSGGIVLFWNSKKFKCEFMVEDKDFIGAIGPWEGVEGLVGLVNVYGPNARADRKETWNKLLALVEKEEVHWCLFGDFNEVRNEEERLNSTVNQGGMQEFNEFIIKGGLFEVPMFGRRFTRISDDGIKFSKLDRFLISRNFGSVWRNLGVRSLERKWSDHTPILLGEDKADYGPKPFKFFDVWLKEDSLESIVSEAWSIEISSSNPDGVLRDKFKNVKRTLKVWSKESFGKIDDEIFKLKKEYSSLELNAENNGWSERERDTWLEVRKKWMELEERTGWRDKRRK